MAWVTSGAPVEILTAMGVATVYPENYGALVGAQRAAVPLAQIAEEKGLSPDLCSYARCHIGSILPARHAPQGGLPKPDILVACNNICGTVLKWYEALAGSSTSHSSCWTPPSNSPAPARPHRAVRRRPARGADRLGNPPHRPQLSEKEARATSTTPTRLSPSGAIFASCARPGPRPSMHPTCS